MPSFKEVLGIKEEEKPIPINASEGVALKNELGTVIEEEEIASSPIVNKDLNVATQQGMLSPAMLSRKARRHLFKLLGLRDGQLTEMELERRRAGSRVELKRRKKFRKKKGLKIS